MRFLYYWFKFFKKIHSKGVINSKLHKTCKVEAGSYLINCKMDRYSYCGYDCQLFNIQIGSFCSISNNVIAGSSMHPLNWVGTSSVFYSGRDSIRKKFSNHNKSKSKEIVVGSDVWIGERVIIKQGVKIGHGAVIGMGSVVTKDVPPYSIVGGVPAKVIRKRFNDDVINRLLKSEWWNFSNEKIEEYTVYFTDVDLFLQKINE